MSVPASAPSVSFSYCTQCRWLLRAMWLAGELLTSFTTGRDLGHTDRAATHTD